MDDARETAANAIHAATLTMASRAAAGVSALVHHSDTLLDHMRAELQRVRTGRRLAAAAGIKVADAASEELDTNAKLLRAAAACATTGYCGPAANLPTLAFAAGDAAHDAMALPMTAAGMLGATAYDDAAIAALSTLYTESPDATTSRYDVAHENRGGMVHEIVTVTALDEHGERCVYLTDDDVEVTFRCAAYTAGPAIETFFSANVTFVADGVFTVTVARTQRVVPLALQRALQYVIRAAGVELCVLDYMRSFHFNELSEHAPLPAAAAPADVLFDADDSTAVNVVGVKHTDTLILSFNGGVEQWSLGADVQLLHVQIVTDPAARTLAPLDFWLYAVFTRGGAAAQQFTFAQLNCTARVVHDMFTAPLTGSKHVFNVRTGRVLTWASVNTAGVLEVRSASGHNARQEFPSVPMAAHSHISLDDKWLTVSNNSSAWWVDWAALPANASAFDAAAAVRYVPLQNDDAVPFEIVSAKVAVNTGRLALLARRSETHEYEIRYCQADTGACALLMPLHVPAGMRVKMHKISDAHAHFALTCTDTTGTLRWV